METLASLLADHPFFRDLPQHHLPTIAGCGRNVHFRPGEFIFRAGDDANELFLVRHGRVALEIATPGQAPITVQTVGPGDILGWSWLVPPYHRAFDAHVIEDARCVAFDAVCIRRKCDEDHDLGYEMLKRLAQVMEERLDATRIQLLDLYGTHT
jgi:CRP-like cAMP-binding protein